MGLDYYGLLEISRNATDDDVKKAYRKLALEYHPKRNKDVDAKKRYALVCEAYDVLSNPKVKALYDQFGEESIKIGIPVPPGKDEEVGPTEVYAFHGDTSKVFRDFFGVDNPFAEYYLPNVDPGYKFFDEPAKPIPGPDQEHPFPLTLEESYYGCTKNIEIPLEVVDEEGIKTVKTTKTFTFTIPKGTRNGQCFQFIGAGTSGLNVLPGNVTFRADLQPHPEFKLEGSDLVISNTVHLAHALTGFILNVTTFDGKRLHIPISDVIKPGYRIPLKGEGMPIADQESRGNLIVEFDVTFPDSLSLNQRQLIRKALIKSTP